MLKKALLTALTALALLVPVGPAAGQVGPTSVVGRTAVHPSPVYRTVFALMETCTGRTGDFDEISWFLAVSMVELGTGRRFAGMYSPRDPGHTIILDKEYAFRLHYVSHEILHYLYGGPDVPMDVAQKCLLDWTSLTLKPR